MGLFRLKINFNNFYSCEFSTKQVEFPELFIEFLIYLSEMSKYAICIEVIV